MTFIFSSESAFVISMLQNPFYKIIGDTDIENSTCKIGNNVN